MCTTTEIWCNIDKVYLNEVVTRAFLLTLFLPAGPKTTGVQTTGEQPEVRHTSLV